MIITNKACIVTFYVIHNYSDIEYISVHPSIKCPEGTNSMTPYRYRSYRRQFNKYLVLKRNAGTARAESTMYTRVRLSKCFFLFSINSLNLTYVIFLSNIIEYDQNRLYMLYTLFYMDHCKKDN